MGRIKSAFLDDAGDGTTPLSKTEREGLKIKSVTTRGELNEVEQDNIVQAKLWLQRTRKHEPLSLPFFRKLHKRMFGHVWRWAGEFRSSGKNIGIDPWDIGPELHNLVTNTAYWIQNATYDWKEIAARFHHRLTLLHPFPNGNGRFAREITDLLLKKHRHAPASWGAEMPLEKRRASYLAALRKADDSKQFDSLIEFVWR